VSDWVLAIETIGDAGYTVSFGVDGARLYVVRSGADGER